MDLDTGIFDYLQVDSFLETLVDAKALETAIELGLIDDLQANPDRSLEEITRNIDGDPSGLRILLKLLVQNEVVEQNKKGFRLSSRFQKVIPYFPLLKAKIDFAGYAVSDFSDRFTDFIQDTDRLRQKAHVFDLFAYNRCFEKTDENLARTEKWVRITTALTRHEAPVCMHYYDFSSNRRMLDIGGNSGEFAFQICKKFHEITAVVFDLPLVCDIGHEHLHREPESERIEFFSGNAFTDDFPTGFDLITFKSMLHDWPAQEAEVLLEKAANALDPGGTLLIFERGPLEHGKTKLTHSVLPFLLFSPSFRSPLKYRDDLSRNGFQDIRIQWIDLDTPFFLLTARKKHST